MNSSKYILSVFFLLCGMFGFMYLDFNDFERSPANYEEEVGPRVNPLIDNQKAFQARHDVWNNPNAQFFYMSTYEFEEDAVGLSQIKWAVERAQEGKTVHIVLDDAGHGLSEETIYYMVKNGVNVHRWSPKFSLRGIKHRYALNRQRLNPVSAAFSSVFRQATYRMHDKILFNDAVTEESQKLLGGEDHVGQVILGGRNARNSHYGLDMERAETQVQFTEEGEKVTKRISNPRYEYEHEVLVHSRKVHRKVKTYITDLINSGFTHRVSAQELSRAYIRGEKKRKAMGKKWKKKIVEKNLKHNNEYKDFAADYARWLKRYERIQNPENGLSPKNSLVSEFFEVFDRHHEKLENLIRDKRINPRLYASTFKSILPQQAHGELLRHAREVERGRIDLSEFFSLKDEILEKNKKEIGVNLLAGKLETEFAHHLVNPKIRLEALPVRVYNKIVNIFGVHFNMEKYQNMQSKLTRNAEWLEHNYVSKKPKNWVRSAKQVDDVDFVHDTVDDQLLEKKVMQRAWEMIGAAEGDIYFNSQYGTPTPRAVNAVDNFLKTNSAVYRLAEGHFDQGMVGVGDKQTDEFVETFLELMRANRENIIESLRGNPSFSSGPSQSLRKTRNKEARETFINAVENLVFRNKKSSVRRLNRQLRTGALSEKEYVDEILNVLRGSKNSISTVIMSDKDKFHRNLLKLRGMVDEDPEEILGQYKKKTLNFMTNSQGSWAIGADKFIHDDFHIAQEEDWIRFGKGVNVAGLEGGGRIHSKVLTTESEALVWSANLDYRSDYINTEVGALITAENKGNSVVREFEQHVQNYMMPAKWYIKDGRFVRDTNCPGIMRRFFIRNILRKQL